MSRKLKRALKRAKETTGMSSMPAFQHVGVEMSPADQESWWRMMSKAQIIGGGSIDKLKGKKGDYYGNR